MPKSLKILIALCVWLFSTGVHWDALQVVGWARMVALYSNEMSLEAAVKKTFDGQELCGVCETVSQGRWETQVDLIMGGDSKKEPLLISWCGEPRPIAGLLGSAPST